MNYRPVTGGFELLEEYFQWLTPFNTGVLIPAGFKWDGITRPWFLRTIFRNSERGVLRATLIHDYLYGTALLPREEADLVFLWVLRCEGYPMWKARLAYYAIRLFGASHYGT